jgi:hypothetical protein
MGCLLAFVVAFAVVLVAASLGVYVIVLGIIGALAMHLLLLGEAGVKRHLARRRARRRA